MSEQRVTIDRDTAVRLLDYADDYAVHMRDVQHDLLASGETHAALTYGRAAGDAEACAGILREAMEGVA